MNYSKTIKKGEMETLDCKHEKKNRCIFSVKGVCGSDTNAPIKCLGTKSEKYKCPKWNK